MALNPSPTKHCLLYLPGFDGTLLSPFLQFPELGTSFNVRGLKIPVGDRSSFESLASLVVREILATPGGCFIVGESFGALVALEAAMRLETAGRAEMCLGLTLVNPATAYARSKLAAAAPPVSRLPSLLYIFGLASLLPLFLDGYQLPQLVRILSGQQLPSVIDSPEREAYMGRVAFTLPERFSTMPQATLVWRLEEWLSVGCAAVSDERMKALTCRALVVVGDEDKVLPSLSEASRLKSTMRDCTFFVVQGAGHASTCGSRADLAALMRNRFPELRGQGLRTAMKDEATATATADAAANTATADTAAAADTAAGGAGCDPSTTVGSTTTAAGFELGMIKRPHPTVSPLDYWNPKYMAGG
jgi:pimeloyl-ACP methyl ester carboxylesterase